MDVIITAKIARVNHGTTTDGRDYYCIEAISSDIGIFRAYVPQDVAEVAYLHQGKDTEVTLSAYIYTRKDYTLAVRVNDIA